MNIPRIVQSIVVLSVAGFFLVAPLTAAYPVESEDAVLYLSAFDSYRKQDYVAAALSMEMILQRFPDTPLRDTAIFWLAQADFRSGKKEEAARLMAAFCREYPDNPLRETADDELLLLAEAFENGEKRPPSMEIMETMKKKQSDDSEMIEKAAAEKSHSLAVEKTVAPSLGEAESDGERLAKKQAAAAKIARIREALKQKAEERRVGRQQSADPVLENRDGGSVRPD